MKEKINQINIEKSTITCRSNNKPCKKKFNEEVSKKKENHENINLVILDMKHQLYHQKKVV